MAGKGITYEPVKIFFDVLFDYINLKYIFEYGFSWDADVTRLIFERDTQKMRELANALPDSVYQNCASVFWAENVQQSHKKSGRRLVWKNHYRLFQNQWFLELYGSYAGYQSWQADYEIEKCKEPCEYKPDSLCSDKQDEQYSKCTFWRICEAEQWEESFAALARGVSDNPEMWKYRKVHEWILENYRDVLVVEKGIRLKKNDWYYPEQRAVFRTEEEYQCFREMLIFFAGFTPLSVLGWNFLKRLGKAARSGDGQSCDGGRRWPQVLIRNLPMNFGLEQEYLYRTLFAVVNGRMVEYEGEDYLPVRLVYRDKGRTGLPEHLYLIAEKKKDSESAELLPLFDGAYICAGSRLPRQAGPNRMNISERQWSVDVEFYYRENVTPYLLERRDECWKDFITEQRTLNDVYEMKSPYYEECTDWKIDLVRYRVPESDGLGLLQFIESFGDFAHVVSMERELPVPERKAKGSQKKGKIKGFCSLLDPYSSDHLIGQLPSGSLPPREAELEWLAFVLKEYPGFCRIFLDEDCIGRIEEQLDKEIHVQGWFSEDHWDFRTRIRNLHKEFAARYADLLKIMRRGGVLKYEWGCRNVRIYPYALEYDVTRHLTRRITKPPMDVMCYSLDEKRNVLIPFEKLRIKTYEPGQEVHFSLEDKLYHVLAYALRCAEAGRQDIWNKAAELLDHLWKEDRRGNDNYNRCIRKRFGKTWDFAAEYTGMEEQAKQCKNAQTAEFLRRIFAYWHEHEGEAEESLLWKYQTLLLMCLKDACRQLQLTYASENIKNALDTITDDEIWRLIGGEEMEGVVNEIAFYNEKLKNSSISFTMKEASRESVELVYKLFENFICAGDLDSEHRLRFTVTYETFFYRKIHMALMVLGNRIERIEPEKTARIIRERLNNIRDNRR